MDQYFFLTRVDEPATHNYWQPALRVDSEYPDVLIADGVITEPGLYVLTWLYERAGRIGGVYPFRVEAVEAPSLRVVGV